MTRAMSAGSSSSDTSKYEHLTDADEFRHAAFGKACPPEEGEPLLRNVGKLLEHAGNADVLGAHGRAGPAAEARAWLPVVV